MTSIATPRSRDVWTITVLMILFLWAVTFPALDRYGVPWDEALGEDFFGARYFSYFTSFDRKYLDFDSDPYPPGRAPDLERSPFRNRPWEYYPVASMMAAATQAVLSRTFGWLDPFDGYHALNPLLAALLLAAWVPFVARRWGLVAAALGAGLLLTMPRVFAHLMANIKDFPLLVLFTLTLLAFLHAYERGSTIGLLGAGALWGLALGSKANALFLPAIPGGLVALDWVRGTVPTAWRERRGRLLAVLAGAGLLGLTVLFASWPYLWPDPIGRAAEHLRYIGLRKGITRPESIAPVLGAIFGTTPLVILGLFACGLVPCFQRAWHGDRLARMLLLWLPAVLGRYLLPASVNFDGVRHFLELFPAVAAIAGLGAATLIAAFLGRLPTQRPVLLKSTAVCLLLLTTATDVLRAHPFQIAYWNRAVGGLAGARAAGTPQAGDYWGLSYRDGLAWLNANAEPDSLLAVPVIEHAVYLQAPERLRRDIGLLDLTTPFSPRIEPTRLAAMNEASRVKTLYVMFVPRRDWMNTLMADCLRRLTPVAAWDLDGAPVLLIYRYVAP